MMMIAQGGPIYAAHFQTTSRVRVGLHLEPIEQRYASAYVVVGLLGLMSCPPLRQGLEPSPVPSWGHDMLESGAIMGRSRAS